jgi:Domain of unknown function (DU1801)
MRSIATTPEEYLAGCDKDRAAALTQLRSLIVDNLPKGYEESMRWGMINYEVPLSTYPNTYNKQPIQLAALANHKSYMSLYLVSPGIIPAHMELLTSSGKKLKMGRSCINFNSLDELPLDKIKEILQASDLQLFISAIQKTFERLPTHADAASRPAAKKKATKKR